MKNMMMKLLVPALALLAIPAGAQIPAGMDPGSLGRNDPMPIRPDYMRTRAVISPVIHPDRRVSFRLNAPEATQVSITGHVIGPRMHWLSPDRTLPLTKGADGVWSITLGPLEPDIYPYSYMVNGAGVSDPGNRINIVEVPGDKPAYYDPQDVPHGDVRMVVYHSKATNSVRYLRVYTPAGYDDSKQRYPVLYLQHGFGESEISWTTTGKANIILDNLIEMGKIKPFALVMSDGMVQEKVGSEERLNHVLLERMLVEEIIPMAEKKYQFGGRKKTL